MKSNGYSPLAIRPDGKTSGPGGSDNTAKALAASELRYRRLFESAKDGILILDADTGMVVDVNPFLTNLLGFSRTEFLGKRIWELGFFKNLAANEDKFSELQIKEYVRYEDLPLETSDGRVREVEFVSNVYLADGKRVIQCNIRDITERKRAEAYRDIRQDILKILNEPGETGHCLPRVLTLLRSKAGFDAAGIRLQDGDDFPYFVQYGFPEDFLQTENTLIEHGRDGGVCRDDQGNICLECTCGLVLRGKTDPANPLFTRGGSAWTNDARLLLDIPPGEDPRHRPRNQCVHQGYASVALVPIRSKDHIVGLLQCNDRRKDRFTLEIMEILEELASHIGSALMRTQAERALAMKAMLLEAQKEASPDGILAVDNEGHTLLFNTRFSEIWRIPREVLDTHDDKTMLEYVSKQLKDAEAFNRTVAHLYENRAETSLDEVHFRDGRCFDRYSSPLKDVEGRIRGRIWYFRDITERKQAEETKSALTDELRHAQKMEAVGRLAGGVAHDFNNMLMVILGNAEMCRAQIAPGQPMREWLDQITGAAERSAEITRQLLAFARKQVIAPKLLDLNDAVSSMLKLLHRLIGEDIELIWQPGANAWSTMIDPSQVDQILANLLVNARDAIAGTGRITLSTKNVTINPDYSLHHVGVAPGDYVMLTVSDTGHGMDEGTRARIFEPFFTTKGVGQGTGLGLPTVHGIVQQNNGAVHVYSEPGHGTTFRIYLPRAIADSAAEPEFVSRARTPRGHGETILLVEDEKSVRAMCERFLRGSGYVVISAMSPEQALDIGRQPETRIDLLLTDVIMPGMGGRDLARRLGETKPAMSVLFMSGYPAEIMSARGELTQATAFLSKPFSRDEILLKVHEVLNAVTAAAGGH
jgi:PAS domain S-box-containing protein